MSQPFVITRGADYEYRLTTTGERFFSGSQVLRAMASDEYAGARAADLAAASARGTQVHYAFSFILGARAGLCPMPARPTDELAGYYDGIVSWADAHKVRPVWVERSACCRKSGRRLAMTPDTLCLYDAKEIPTLVDLKTTEDVHYIHRVQVMLQRWTEGYERAKQLCVLYARRDGTVREEWVVPDPTDEAAAQNAIGLLEWRLRRGIRGAA